MSIGQIRRRYPDLDIAGGNVATDEGTTALIEAGVNVVKVGVGPGRFVRRVSFPAWACRRSRRLAAALKRRRVITCRSSPTAASNIPAILQKHLAAGADSVMIGSLFAGTEESPGETILYQGRTYKVYRGMGSLGAMGQGSRDRYGQADVMDSKKLVPEGIEGQVPYKGSLSFNIHQLVGGLRAGMGYLGCKDVAALHSQGASSCRSLRRRCGKDTCTTCSSPKKPPITE